jgi:hypothetical protein
MRPSRSMLFGMAHQSYNGSLQLRDQALSEILHCLAISDHYSSNPLLELNTRAILGPQGAV